MYFKSLLVSILLGTAYYSLAQVITKESTVPNYQLPKLLRSNTGQKITHAGEWERVRRPEILQMLEEQLYGLAPSVTVNFPSDVTNSRDKFMNGKASMKEITIHLTYEGKSLDLNMLLFLPNKIKDNIPVIIGLNEYGNHTVFPEETFSVPKGWVPNDENFGITNNTASKLSRGIMVERWPILNMINRGYGIALIYCGDIDPDFDDGFKNGAHAFLPSIEGDKAWGSIAAWSWGIRQVIEYFRYLPEVNRNNVILAGNGPLGTAVLWAAALDNRVGLVIAQNTGIDGASLSNRQFGATINNTLAAHPHWFAKNFQQYAGKEKNLPFDQHFLLSLVAPRPIYLSNTFDATDADPTGTIETATKTNNIYLLYDRLGMEQKEFPATTTVNHDGYVAYHIRNGKPSFTIYDWERFLDYADVFYK